MDIVAQTALPLAAAGYSLVYLLAGGGFFGAMVIFVILKMVGKQCVFGHSRVNSS